MLKVVSFDPVLVPSYFDGRFFLANLANKDDKPSMDNGFVLNLNFEEVDSHAREAFKMIELPPYTDSLGFWDKVYVIVYRLFESIDESQYEYILNYNNIVGNDVFSTLLRLWHDQLKDESDKEACLAMLHLLACSLSLARVFIWAKDQKSTESETKQPAD